MTDIWLPSSVNRGEEMQLRDVGQGLVRAFQDKGLTPADLLKAVRKGADGQTITDLSELARFMPGNTDAMGAPFATSADPNGSVFSAAGMGPGAPAIIDWSPTT